LFPWANHELVQHDKVLQHQRVYFNTTWLIIRAAIYFAIWIAMAMRLGRGSLEYERTDDFGIVRRMRKLSAGGLVVLVVTISLAAVDWVMSRELHFFTTIIGFIVAVGMTLSAMALVVALLRILIEQDELRKFVSGDVLIDLGNLLLTLVILWAYMSFAQLLIIWMGNIDHETPWYIHRGLGQRGSIWSIIALLLLLLHFVVPFLMLLSRDAKRDLKVITSVALLILVMRAVDVYWLIAPSSASDEHRSHLSWMDLPLLIGMFGLWFAAFVAMLRRRPLVARVEMDEEEAAAATEKAAHDHAAKPHGTSPGGPASASPTT
jgi:hypothetical protein